MSTLNHVFGRPDHQKRKELLACSLKIKEKHYGSEHFEVGITLRFMASACLQLGDDHNAKELTHRSQKIMRQRDRGELPTSPHLLGNTSRHPENTRQGKAGKVVSFADDAEVVP